MISSLWCSAWIFKPRLICLWKHFICNKQDSGSSGPGFDSPADLVWLETEIPTRISSPGHVGESTTIFLVSITFKVKLQREADKKKTAALWNRNISIQQHIDFEADFIVLYHVKCLKDSEFIVIINMILYKIFHYFTDMCSMSEEAVLRSAGLYAKQKKPEIGLIYTVLSENTAQCKTCGDASYLNRYY